MTQSVNREVCITGYGLLSPLGETPEAWWQALNDPAGARSLWDSDSYAPYHAVPIGEYDLASQVSRRGDQRAMEPMMQYGVYAAGLALDMAGLKDNEALLPEVNLVVAAGGGERDWALDKKILEELPGRNDRDSFLNQQLADGLRPTLFLAQLPNLFAGNISIIFKASGSSRTFMGEEPAGVDAVRVAWNRIRSGQSDIFLVGAAYNASRPDMMLTYHNGNILLADGPADLWNRPDAGMVPGSAGAFVVMEPRERAQARGARILGTLKNVQSHRTKRAPGAASATAQRQFDSIRAQMRPDGLAILSGASGYGPITGEEKQFLSGLEEDLGAPVRGTAEATGHAMDASFLQNLVLGVAALEKGEVFGPLSDDPLEKPATGVSVSQVLITSWGHLRGEAMALVEAEPG